MKIDLQIPGPAGLIRVGQYASDPNDAFAPLHMTLDLLVALNCWILKRTSRLPSIYDGGVVYRSEGPGREKWLTVDLIHAGGWGDCEDLACARAAELIVWGGINACVDLKSKWTGGILLIHIFVRLPDGTTEDPSAKLGMRGEYQ